MSKLYLTMDETTVRISNRPPAPKELPPMERDELIAFIAYLKENVREEDVPHDIRMIGLFWCICPAASMAKELYGRTAEESR